MSSNIMMTKIITNVSDLNQKESATHKNLAASIFDYKSNARI